MCIRDSPQAAELHLDVWQQRGGIEPAGGDQHRVVRLVPGLVEGLQAFAAFYLPEKLANASATYGALGITLTVLTYLFVVGALLRTHVPPPAKVVHAAGWRQFTAGVHIARSNRAVWRLLVTLFSFSLLSLPYVGLFAAVVRLNFGVDKGSTTYEWLYATWGFGACFGGLAIGTVFVGWDKRALIRYGFAAFACTLAAFALVREPIGAFIVAPLLGFAYFATTTSMNTVLQSRLEDHERGRVMALWFMAFGGTVPLGNLVFAPMIDAIGARWVLLGGALWALFLGWWCDIERIDRSAEEGSSDALQPDHTASFDEHGVSAGE